MQLTVIYVLLIFSIGLNLVLLYRNKAFFKTKVKSTVVNNSATQLEDHKTRIMREAANDLHNNSGQLLSLIKIDLSSLQEQHPTPKIESCIVHTNTILKEIRRICRSLNQQ